MTGMLPRK